MPVYYRGPDVLITGELFTAPTVVRCAYVLADLANVRIVQSATADRHRLPMFSTGLAMLLMVPAVGGPPEKLFVPLLLVAVVMAGTFVLTRPTAQYDLVALYRGRVVVLFSSADQREFDQVCRGLQRALERIGDRL